MSKGIKYCVENVVRSSVHFFQRLPVSLERLPTFHHIYQKMQLLPPPNPPPPNSSSTVVNMESFDVIFDEDEPREEIVEDLIEEWSVASFSWRNRNNPNFILAKITQDQIALSKCYLPEEDSVITMYLFGFTAIIIYSLYNRRRFRTPG